jgi:hypothetical protein
VRSAGLEGAPRDWLEDPNEAFEALKVGFGVLLEPKAGLLPASAGLLVLPTRAGLVAGVAFKAEFEPVETSPGADPPPKAGLKSMGFMPRLRPARPVEGPLSMGLGVGTMDGVGLGEIPPAGVEDPEAASPAFAMAGLLEPKAGLLEGLVPKAGLAPPKGEVVGPPRAGFAPNAGLVAPPRAGLTPPRAGLVPRAMLAPPRAGLAPTTPRAGFSLTVVAAGVVVAGVGLDKPLKLNPVNGAIVHIM